MDNDQKKKGTDNINVCKINPVVRKSGKKLMQK